jgi:hypothetical protein
MADEQVVDTQVKPEGSTTTEQKPTGTQTPNPEPKPGVQTGETDADRRFRGIQADLQNERKARQRAEQQFRDTQTSLDAERKRVQALAGLEPKSEADITSEAVKQRFAQLFPGLAKLDEAAIERILQVANDADNLQSATQHHWTTHGAMMLDAVTEGLADSLGGKLSDRQAAAIKRAYVQEAEDNPDFLKRHERGDRTLVDEFVKQWVADWIEPARRININEQVNQQRRVPNSSGRRDVTATAPKPIDYKNPKAVEDAMVESFRQHGGKFGD